MSRERANAAFGWPIHPSRPIRPWGPSGSPPSHQGCSYGGVVEVFAGLVPMTPLFRFARKIHVKQDASHLLPGRAPLGDALVIRWPHPGSRSSRASSRAFAVGRQRSRARDGANDDVQPSPPPRDRVQRIKEPRCRLFCCLILGRAKSGAEINSPCSIPASTDGGGAAAVLVPLPLQGREWQASDSLGFCVCNPTMPSCCSYFVLRTDDTGPRRAGSQVNVVLRCPRNGRMRGQGRRLC